MHASQHSFQAISLSIIFCAAALLPSISWAGNASQTVPSGSFSAAEVIVGTRAPAQLALALENTSTVTLHLRCYSRFVRIEVRDSQNRAIPSSSPAFVTARCLNTELAPKQTIHVIIDLSERGFALTPGDYSITAFFEPDSPTADQHVLATTHLRILSK
jgi:hypothetical protein